MKKEKKEEKKEEEKKEEVDASAEPIKTEDATQKRRKKNSSRNNNRKVELGTITSLIQELDDNTDLYLRLSQNDYLNQYTREIEYQKLGYSIDPYIDKNEFLKKMNKV